MNNIWKNDTRNYPSYYILELIEVNLNRACICHVSFQHYLIFVPMFKIFMETKYNAIMIKI